MLHIHIDDHCQEDRGQVDNRVEEEFHIAVFIRQQEPDGEKGERAFPL